MKEIHPKALKDLISKYSDYNKSPKPLMLWFSDSELIVDVRRKLRADEQKYTSIAEHPIRGHEYMIHNGETVKVSDYPEWLENDVMRDEFTRAKRLLYYQNSVGNEAITDIKYGLYWAESLQIPLICLMRTSWRSSFDSANLQFLNEKFENYMVI